MSLRLSLAPLTKLVLHATAVTHSLRCNAAAKFVRLDEDAKFRCLQTLLELLQGKRT